MTTNTICIHCGQPVMFADPNVTLDHHTICPNCLKKHFPKAAHLLTRYNRRTQPITPIPQVTRHDH